MSRKDRKIQKNLRLYEIMKRNFEKTLKVFGKDLSDAQKKEALEKFKLNYAQAIIDAPKSKGFGSKLVSFLAKKIAWDNKVEGKFIDVFTKVIPTQIDDAILKAGMKVNNWTVDTAISGLDNLAKKLDRTDENQEAAETAANIILHNHKEWYIRFKGNNLSPLNYYDSVDEETEINPSNSVLTPLIIRIPLALVLPEEVNFKARLMQAFTANETSLVNARGYGYAEYSSKDVGLFINNTRKLIALLAKAIRMAKSYNNYEVDNLMKPDVLIYANSPRFYTPSEIKKERSILTSLKERIRLAIQDLKTCTAGSCPLYDRTLFLLSNYFEDSKSNKSVVYMFDLDLDDEEGYFKYVYRDSSSSLATEIVTGSALNNITNILNTFDKMINDCFRLNKWAKQIRSDINFLFGITGSTHYTDYFEKAYKDIDKPAKAIHDESILLQIHNLDIRCRPVQSIAFTGSHATYEHYGSTARPYTMFLNHFVTNYTDIATTVYSLTNLVYQKVNAWKKLNADELMAATRFKQFNDTTINITGGRIYSDNGTNLGLTITMNGNNQGKFEVPTAVQVITYDPSWSGSDVSTQFMVRDIMGPGNLLMPILFNTVTQDIENHFLRSLAIWAWSYSDWMPHAYSMIHGAFHEDGDENELVVDFKQLNKYVMHDLDVFGNINNTQLNPMDQCAILSEIIWSQNGANLIDVEKAKQARSNKSSNKK